MLHSLSALGPERSLIAFWEPLLSGAPAEQPRESAYAWGTAWATSLLWPSSQGQPAWRALCCLERGPSPACPLSAVLVLSVAGVAGLAPSMTLLRAPSQTSRCRSTRKCFPPLSGGVGLCSKLRHKTKANRQKQNQVNNGNRGGRSFGLAARIVTVERSGWVEQKDILKISLDCSGCGLRVDRSGHDCQQRGRVLGTGHQWSKYVCSLVGKVQRIKSNWRQCKMWWLFSQTTKLPNYVK